MSECGEVARGLAAGAPKFNDLNEARVYVRDRMPDETHTVVDNVAWALYHLQGAPEQCPQCDSTNVSERITEDRFEYVVGRRVTYLTARVPMMTCATCGLTYTDYRGEELRAQAVREHLQSLAL